MFCFAVFYRTLSFLQTEGKTLHQQKTLGLTLLWWSGAEPTISPGLPVYYELFLFRKKNHVYVHRICLIMIIAEIH